MGAMANGEVLRRVEAEVARTNEILEQERVAWKSQMAEHGSSLQDIRFEMRQMSLRGERIAQTYVRAIEELTDDIRENTRAVRDISDQVRANTQAVLRALDRFDAGSGPAPAGA
jgi:methyl-accepting chemotaxis protein